MQLIILDLINAFNMFILMFFDVVLCLRKLGAVMAKINMYGNCSHLTKDMLWFSNRKCCLL